MEHAQAFAIGPVAAGEAGARLGQPLPRGRQLRRVLELEQTPAWTGTPADGERCSSARDATHAIGAIALGQPGCHRAAYRLTVCRQAHRRPETRPEALTPLCSRQTHFSACGNKLGAINCDVLATQGMAHQTRSRSRRPTLSMASTMSARHRSKASSASCSSSSACRCLPCAGK